MKKLLFTSAICIMLLALALALSACSTDTDDGATTTTTTTTAPPAQPGPTPAPNPNIPTEGLAYNLLDDGTYEVSVGDATDVEHIVIPSTHEGEPVTRIGDHAFFACTSLKSITIPSSVTNIGEEAFSHCESLKSITIPSSVTSIGEYAFVGCDSLENVTFGENSQLQSIGEYAFIRCTSLKSITIPSSVKSMGLSPFFNCANLESITVDINNQNYKSINGNLYSKDGKTLIQYAIGKKETSFAIPDGVTSIGGEAFYYCSSLVSITMPSSVTSINSSAFLGCYRLVEVYNLSTLDISNGDVGDYVLNVYTPTTGESKLSEDENGFIIYTDENKKILVDYNGDKTDIAIPDGITEINKYAFVNCMSLTSIEIPSSVTSIGRNAFYNCTSLTSVTFGDNSQLTSIGDYAFNGCTSLTSVTFGENSQLTSIGSSAFEDCTSLNSVTFGENSQLASIGYSAFYGCHNLTSITIPSSVTSIGYRAFYNCYKLVEVYNLSTLNITKSSYDNGYIGYYATDIYTDINIPSKLSEDENGFIIYTDGDKKILVGYNGNKTDIAISDGITEIYKYAFYNCTSLTSITIPSSVASINSSAFFGCSNLIQNVDGIYYIDNWIIDSDFNISEAIVRDGTVGIGKQAFRDRDNLVTVSFPSSIKYINNDAFDACTNIKTIYISDIVSWCSVFVENSYALPFPNADELYIGGTLVRNLVIPDGVESISAFAFVYCKCIDSVSIPSSVKSIGFSAFGWCTNLSNITFRENSKLTSIGKYAFCYCTNLTSITIPSSVTSIGDDAFANCYKLVEVYNLSTLNITKSSYDNGYVGYYATDIYIDINTPSKLSEDENGFIIYTDGDKKILVGYNGYKTDIAITDGITEIYKYAFYNCTSLESVTFGDNSKLTSIGSYAFYWCRSLTSITMPSSVTSIGYRAFSGCDSLNSVIFENPDGWWRSSSSTAISGTAISGLSDASTAAEYLTSTYCNYYWKRS